MTTNSLRYRKLYALDRARGITRRVPAGPVAAHVRALMAAGASQHAIADASGVNHRIITFILRGQPTIHTTTAERLRAVTAAATRNRTRPTGQVPNIGARRRIQALRAIGWTTADIAHHADLSPSLIRDILARRGSTITRTVHDGIRSAYDALAMTPGPSKTSRTRALARGWAPPLAWDDDTMDDPNSQPHQGNDTADVDQDELDHAAIWRRMDGDRTIALTQAEAAEVITRMRRRGYSDAHITRHTGLKVERYAPLQRDLQAAS
ncbi:hypothetical protein [Actinopolymorpha alba]|uniref:hypothetical protein n=1 Tax=Actinopolymorpha alba TaxID=533267 RepID=UPI00037A697B|nr:hypothetical protein [Actinopolymorpha alba]